MATMESIDLLPISESWKIRFRAIYAAGGPKLPQLKSLPKKDRRKAYALNFYAFFFGPFYYAAKGMWKRGLVLLALSMAVVIPLGIVLDTYGLLRLSKSLVYGVSALYAIRANLDYYKKMVLQDNGWW